MASEATDQEMATQRKIAVTDTLCQFISDAAACPDVILTPRMMVRVKEFVLDHIGVGIAGAALGESSEQIYDSVKGLLDAFYFNDSDQPGVQSRKGCVVLGKPRLFPAPVAALLNGTFSHTLDFDDTHGGAAVHPGAPVIAAVLSQAQVYAHENGMTQTPEPRTILADTQRVLVAIAIGYEVTVRLALALGLESYTRGFHATGTAGIFGAVAALSVLKSLSVRTIQNAFGLAISQASGSMQYLSNGSWGKRLHPGWAAHNAFICVALAEGGALGASEPIEGTYGLLHSFTAKQCGADEFDAILAGLGENWVFLATSCKPWPGCRGTHCGMQIAAKMRKEAMLQRQDYRTNVENITVYLPESHIQVVGTPLPNKINPKNIVDAQFSLYYQVAVALLYGTELAWNVYDHIGDEEVMKLCRIITIQGDPAYQKMQNRIRTQWKDGLVQEETLEEPLGEKTQPFQMEHIKAKFLACVEPAYGKNKAAEICQAVEKLEEVGVVKLMELARSSL